MPALSEDRVERAVLEWLFGVGYTVLHEPDISAGRSYA